MFSCPFCNTPFLSNTIDEDLGLAQCGACDEVSERDQWVALKELTEELEPTEEPASTEELDLANTSVQAEGLLPLRVARGFERWSEGNGDEFVLSHRWRSSLIPGQAGLAALVVFMCFPGVRGLWYAIVNPFAWLWLCSAYFLVATAVNSTTIRIQGGRLRVQHAPLPWSNTLSVSIQNVAHIFVRPVARRTKKEKRRSPTWDLIVRRKKGGEAKVIRSWDVKEELEWVKQRLDDEIRVLRQFDSSR